ncbi:MAG: HAMP domain-containing histidine kinase, partial [Planctomycetota bacterium]|nr:HAMP domain-containing histidine kinase [Planctomycetota bacterium]
NRNEGSLKPSYKEEDLKRGVLFAKYAALAVKNARFAETIIKENRNLKAADLSRAGAIAEILHELRTPISALRTYLDNFISGVFGELTATQKIKAQKMVEQIEKINSIIERLQKGAQKELKLKRVSLARLVENALDTTEHLLKEAGLSVEVNLPEEQEIVVDEQMFEQAIVNILTNAAKYAGSGASVIVSAKIEKHSLLLCIANSGEGIPPSELDRIFKESYRLKKHLKVEGSGLGLKIVKRIVEAHGGEVWAESPGERGALFYIRIPVQ